MKKTFFTVGPSHLYPGMADFINEGLAEHISSISHRSAAYSQVHEGTVQALRELMGVPADYHIFFTGSATEAMERILQNTVEQQSLHFVNGAFSEKWAKFSKQLGKTPQIIQKPAGEGFAPHEVVITDAVELVCFTHNETSTGVRLPNATIAAAKAQKPKVLVAVDITSSAPLIDFDWTAVDIALFSVQKCFGMPAGLGVLIVGPAAMAKVEALTTAGHVVGTYHSFPSLAKTAAKHQTQETPNVLGIYLLGRVARDMLKLGRQELAKGEQAKAQLLYGYLEATPELAPFVLDPQYRSPSVVVADVLSGSSTLVTRLGEQGLIVGKGYGEFKGNHIRIANFPALSLEDVRELLDVLSQAPSAQTA